MVYAVRYLSNRIEDWLWMEDALKNCSLNPTKLISKLTSITQTGRSFIDLILDSVTDHW